MEHYEIDFHFPITDAEPAEYNPRQIADDRFQELKRSLTELGVIRPIIVGRESKKILAGHQRTKAMKSIGIVTCPAVMDDAGVIVTPAVVDTARSAM